MQHTARLYSGNLSSHPPAEAVRAMTFHVKHVTIVRNPIRAYAPAEDAA